MCGDAEANRGMPTVLESGKAARTPIQSPPPGKPMLSPYFWRELRSDRSLSVVSVSDTLHIPSPCSILKQAGPRFGSVSAVSPQVHRQPGWRRRGILPLSPRLRNAANIIHSKSRRPGVAAQKLQALSIGIANPDCQRVACSVILHRRRLVHRPLILLKLPRVRILGTSYWPCCCLLARRDLTLIIHVGCLCYSRPRSDQRAAFGSRRQPRPRFRDTDRTSATVCGVCAWTQRRCAKSPPAKLHDVMLYHQ